MTKPLIKPELRFKLDVIAAKYGTPNRGMTVGQVVTGIIKSTNDLTQEEKITLEQICKVFKITLRELERGIRR